MYGAASHMPHKGCHHIWLSHYHILLDLLCFRYKSCFPFISDFLWAADWARGCQFFLLVATVCAKDLIILYPCWICNHTHSSKREDLCFYFSFQEPRMILFMWSGKEKIVDTRTGNFLLANHWEGLPCLHLDCRDWVLHSPSLIVFQVLEMKWDTRDSILTSN